MTSNTRADDRILGSLRSVDGTGIARIERRFSTDVDDLWSALTDPSRLARWLGEVEGELRLGGEFRAHFLASGWHWARRSLRASAAAASAHPETRKSRSAQHPD